MHDFNAQNSYSDTEIEIVDLQMPDRGIALFFFSLGKISSPATKYLFSRIPHLYPLLIFALLLAILVPASSSMNTPPVPAHPLFDHPGTFQFGACDVSVNTTPGHGFSVQPSTSPPIYPTWGASAACTDQIQLQITVLPMPQNNRNHDP